MTENEPQTGLPPDPHTDVTASEVASYAYCAKAWHLRYVLRREPSGQAVAHQQAGVVSHEIHGMRVKTLAWLERRSPVTTTIPRGSSVSRTKAVEHLAMRTLPGRSRLLMRY